MTVHDQILIEADEEQSREAEAALEECMVEASRTILDGFALRVETKAIGYPDRYTDPRGDEMWGAVIELIDSIEREKAA